MATAQGVTTERKPFGKKLVNYLAANPSEYDVTFLVGPEKKKIRSLRIALKAASPALDKLFKEKWETGLGRGESEIPFPDLDPVTFQTFIELLLSDDWSVEEIEGMKFPAEILINLLKMSKDLEMKDLEKVIQPLADKIFVDFESFSKSADFLKLSPKNLEIILASDLLPMKEIEIFSVTCKWAEKQCAEQGLEPIGHNLRGRLGSAIFKIRFTLMTNAEFGNVVCSKDILTVDEQLHIFLCLSTGKPNNSRENSFPFNTQRRKNRLNLKDRVSVAQANVPVSIVVEKQQDGIVNFFKEVRIVNDPPFVCDRREKTLIDFNVSSRIALESVGFLGPVNRDATYDVTIHLRRHSPNSHPFASQSICSIKTKVEAKQRQIFQVSFEDLPEIEAYATRQNNAFTWTNGYYFISVLMQGPDTQSAQFLNGSRYKDSCSEVDGITIYTRHYCDHAAEIKFKKC